MRKLKLLTIQAAAFSIAVSGGSMAQADVSKETLDSISIADKVDTPIGELTFFDGVPTDATISTVYDNLDRMRGVEAYLDNMGGVSIQSVLDGLAKAGADAPNKIALFRVVKQILLYHYPAAFFGRNFCPRDGYIS